MGMLPVQGQQQLLGLGIPTLEHKVFLDGPDTDVLCRAALKVKLCVKVLAAHGSAAPHVL